MIEKFLIRLVVGLIEKLIGAIAELSVDAWRSYKRTSTRKRGKKLAAEEREDIKSGDPDRMLEGNAKGEKFFEDHVDN